MKTNNSTLTPTLIFATTLFLSALLLFSIQPMFGKLLLPLLGGTPAVWNTCMVFYQALVFLGYSYAHFSPARLSISQQVACHLGLFALSLLILPVALPEQAAPTPGGSPILWLLGVLSLAIGLPFFVVSATAPLLQKWFSRLNHHASEDPYFLYAASNAGSLIALLSYPFLIEPNLGLAQQRLSWSIGFGLLGLFLAACTYLYWKTARHSQQANTIPLQETETTADITELSKTQLLHWLLLAFVPSSLLLGVTNYISTDIAAVPLLWIIPLSLYLLSFVIVFSRSAERIHPLMIAAQPVCILPLIAFSFINPAAIPYWLNLLFHLLAFFMAIMVCHGELAKNRPATSHLTHYYLIMSLGGMLGGLFNTFLAPALFNTVVEYPLMIVAALLLRPNLFGKQDNNWQNWSKDLALPGLLLLIGMVMKFSNISIGRYIDSIGVILLVLVGVSYALRHRPRNFGFYCGVLILLAVGLHSALSNVIFRERTFFGVMSVRNTIMPEMLGERRVPRRFRELWHGTTKHGAQHLDAGLRCEPLTYYSRSGPIGQFFQTFQQRSASWNIGVIGLGAGAMAAYAQPGQHWQFFEIDPEVNRIASQPEFFTYVSDCHNSDVKLLAGDGRLLLQAIPDNSLDVMVLDAFSSDAIPTHLLTREAFALYKQKLSPNGYMAFHITNRHLDLQAILSSLAWDSKYSLLAQQYFPTEDKPQITRADWVIIARNETLLKPLKQHSPRAWKALPLNLQQQPWSDDFTNIFDVWKNHADSN